MFTVPLFASFLTSVLCSCYFSFITRSICQGKHVPWEEACVQKEDPRKEVLPQPSLQWALCVWFALWRGPEGHQRGAAAAGLGFRQLTLLQHYSWAPGAGHISRRHPWRALEGDLWSSASPNCQVAWLVRGLEGPFGWRCSGLVQKRDVERWVGLMSRSPFPIGPSVRVGGRHWGQDSNVEGFGSFKVKVMSLLNQPFSHLKLLGFNLEGRAWHWAPLCFKRFQRLSLKITW